MGCSSWLKRLSQRAMSLPWPMAARACFAASPRPRSRKLMRFIPTPIAPDETRITR